MGLKDGVTLFKEKGYVLRENSKLPFVAFMENDLKEHYENVRLIFSSYCKKNNTNPNASFSFASCLKDLRDTRDIVNLKKMVSAHLALMKNNRKIDSLLVRDQPIVQYRLVDEEVVNKIDENNVVLEATSSKQSRIVQQKFKDGLVNSLIPLNKKLLDLGSPSGVMDASLDMKGSKLEVLAFDLRNKVKIDLNKVDYSLYSDRVFTLFHSLYHVSLEILPFFFKHSSVFGITILSDGVGVVEGEGYKLKKVLSVRNAKGPVSYTICGNVYGRMIYDEKLYDSNFLRRNGFVIATFPHEVNPFVRTCVAIFKGGYKLKSSLPHIEPIGVTIKLASSKNLYTHTKDKLYDAAQIEGFLENSAPMSFYQTPKIDGVSMDIIVCSSGKIYMIDRKVNLFSLYNDNIKISHNSASIFKLSVEVLNYSTVKSLIYLNNVLEPDVSCKEQDALSEMEFHRLLINRIVGFEFVGRKNYHLTCGNGWKFETTLPSDGVVYVPAILTSRFYFYRKRMRGQLHYFCKLFKSSDVLMRSLSGWKKSGVDILYHTVGSCLTEENPYINMDVPFVLEGHHYPSGYVSKNEAFVVTHIRFDKRTYDTLMSHTFDSDSLLDGVVLYTSFWKHFNKNNLNGRELVAYGFLQNLSPSRLVANVDSYSVPNRFFTMVMSKWKLLFEKFISSKRVISSDLAKWGDILVLASDDGDYKDVDIVTLMNFFTDRFGESSSRMLMMTFFLFAHVKNKMVLRRGKVLSSISFSLYSDYDLNNIGVLKSKKIGDF